jgi:hypothetical protein
MNETADHKCQPMQPSKRMKAWIDLAVKYERAGSLTPEAEQAAASMATFLKQPAEVYCGCEHNDSYSESNHNG